MKNILLLVPRMNIGGAESYVALVARSLKSLGYNNAEIKQALNGLDLSDAVSLSDAVKNALKALKKK